MLLQQVVRVTKNRQVTIPKELRDKYGIKAGDQLILEAVKEGMLLRKMRLSDMVGIDAGYATVEQVNQMIDKMREEY